ncbi:MAG: cupin domain-containing protein [Bacteroidales bacterium]|nr:cupin domain-containing protein [Bacteroidales bacterium]
MERRLFVQIPFLAFASSLISRARGVNIERSSKGIKVEAGKDRFQEELHIMGGKFCCVISAKDTAGDFCAYDTTRDEKGGPAFHLHHDQDEWFYVSKGEFIAQVGEDKFNLLPGDSLFAPRKIPHAFAKVNEGEAQMLVLFQPAGQMEDFFKEMAKLGNNIPKDQEIKLKELWRSHGMEIVGSPLKF